VCGCNAELKLKVLVQSIQIKYLHAATLCTLHDWRINLVALVALVAFCCILTKEKTYRRATEISPLTFVRAGTKRTLRDHGASTRARKCEYRFKFSWGTEIHFDFNAGVSPGATKISPDGVNAMIGI
jgi:hypothetical protein